MSYLAIAQKVITAQERRKHSGSICASIPLNADAAQNEIDEVNELMSGADTLWTGSSPGASRPRGAAAVQHVSAPHKVNELRPTAQALHQHLAVLLGAIHAGCRQGLTRHLERTDAEIVRALLSDIGAGYPDLAGYRARCQQAGRVVVLAGLVADYRARLQRLREMGDPDDEVFHFAARLELALAGCPDSHQVTS